MDIGEEWESFYKMIMIKMKVVDSDANNKISTSNNFQILETSNTTNYNSSGYKTIQINLLGQTRTLQHNKRCPKTLVNKIRNNKHETRKLVVTEETDGEDIQTSIPTNQGIQKYEGQAYETGKEWI